jgi:hypothetical protein
VGRHRGDDDDYTFSLMRSTTHAAGIELADAKNDYDLVSRPPQM